MHTFVHHGYLIFLHVLTTYLFVAKFTGRRRGKRDVSAWPKGVSGEHVEIEIAQKLLSSELLVQEDEDFISNFILTDEALEQHRERLKAIEDGSGATR